MKKVKGKPITGAKTEMRPQANVLANPGNPSREAERLVDRPPMPFQTKNGPAQMSTGSGSKALIGVGNGKSANTLLRGSAKTNLSGAGDQTPGGYSKVVGGQKGLTHPSRKGEVTMGTSPKRNAQFFGGAR